MVSLHGSSGRDRTQFYNRYYTTTTSTDDATSISSTTARLNGNLTSLGTAPSVNVSFEWGTATGGPYPNSTTPPGEDWNWRLQYGPIKGWQVTPTYYFRAKADAGYTCSFYG